MSQKGGSQREAIYVGGASQRQRRNQNFNLMAEDVKAVLQEPLEYEVVYEPFLRIRLAPSRHVHAVGRVRHGTVVHGFPAGNWLRISRKEVGRFVEEGDELLPEDSLSFWLLIDGSHLGKGSLLAATWAALTVTASFSQAVELSWPGAKCDDVTYYVQWVPAQSAEHDADDYGSDGSASDGVASDSEEEELNFGEDGEGGESGSGEAGSNGTGGYVISTSPKALLHRLPAGSRISIRIVARISGVAIDFEERDVISAWTEVETGPVLDEYEELLCEDPNGEKRGRCSRTDCKGYVACDDSSPVLKDRCRRCGASYDEHDIGAAEASGPVTIEERVDKEAEAEAETVENDDDDSSDVESEDQDEEEDANDVKDEAMAEDIDEEQDAKQLDDSDEEADVDADALGEGDAERASSKQSVIAEDELEQWRRSIEKDFQEGEGIEESATEQLNDDSAPPEVPEASLAGPSESEEPPPQDSKVVTMDADEELEEEEMGGMSFTVSSTADAVGEDRQPPTSSTVDQVEETSGERGIVDQFSEAADELAELLGQPLSYEVLPVMGSLEIRAEPRVEALVIGTAEPGDILQGFPAGEWFQVLSQDGSFSWVLADGSAFGLGMLLESYWARISFCRIESDMVEVEWSGLPSTITPLEHRVEWRHAGSDSIYSAQTVPTSGSGYRAVLSDLPVATRFELRVMVRVASPRLERQVLHLTGAWYDFATLPSSSAGQVEADAAPEQESEIINAESGAIASGEIVEDDVVSLSKSAEAAAEADVQYVVVGQTAAYYAEQAATFPVGFLHMGQFVQGRESNGWLAVVLPATTFAALAKLSLQYTTGGKLDLDYCHRSDAADVEKQNIETPAMTMRWMPLDSSLAQVVENGAEDIDTDWGMPFVINRFAEALHIQWPGMGDQATKYDLEWKQNMPSQDSVYPLEDVVHLKGLTKPIVILHKLPEGASLQLRVIAHCPTRAPIHMRQRYVVGPWVTMATSKLYPAGDDACIGPNGERYGRCEASGCKGYYCLLDEDDPFMGSSDAVLCGRCGMSVFEHEVEVTTTEDQPAVDDLDLEDVPDELPHSIEPDASGADGQDAASSSSPIDKGSPSKAEHGEADVPAKIQAEVEAVPLPDPALAAAKARPVDSAGAASKLAACKKAAANSRAVLKEPLVYEVVKAGGASVRSEPRADAPQLHLAPKGSRLLGFSGQGWLKIHTNSNPKLVGAWIFVGTQLRASCMKVQVQERFAEALLVSWPGVPAGTSVYSVEWRQAVKDEGMDPKRGHKLSLKPEVIVDCLPAGEPLQIRVVARVSEGSAGIEDIQVYGGWSETIALRPLELDFEDAPDLSSDPFSDRRGKCTASKCRGYVRFGEVTSVNKIGSPYCARCGHHFKEHSREGESGSDNEPSADKRSKAAPDSPKEIRAMPRRTFRVAHKYVFIRDSPSTKGKQIGGMREGCVVSGIVRGKWLCFDPRELDQSKGSGVIINTSQEDGYLLIDGSEVGLGQLLVPHDDKESKSVAKAPPVRPPSAADLPVPSKSPEAQAGTEPSSQPQGAQVDPSAKLEFCIAGAENSKSVLQQPLEYEVVKAEGAVVRVEPRPVADEVCTLPVGTTVFGFSGGGWLRLQKGGNKELQSKAVGSWIFVGVQLAVRCLMINVVDVFAEAVEIAWSGVPIGKSAYSIEWKEIQRGGSSKDPSRGHTISTKTQTLVNNLPTGLEVSMRVVARVSPGEDSEVDVDCRVFGPWKTLTLKALDDDADVENLCMDNTSVHRGKCSLCSCARFVRRDSMLNMNSSSGAGVCARCGHAATSHENLDSGSSTKYSVHTYKVAHTHVNLRAEPNTNAKQVGVLKKGSLVRGTPLGNWLKVNPGEVGNPIEAWILMNAEHLKLGKLLVPHPDVTGPSKISSQSSSDKADDATKVSGLKQGRSAEKKTLETQAHGLSDLAEPKDEPLPLQLVSSMRRILTQPLEYEIVGSSKGEIQAFAQPESSSKCIKSLSVGMVIKGYPALDWILVLPEEVWVHSPEKNVPVDEDLEVRIVPKWSKFEVEASFAEAVDLQWPGLPKLFGAYRAAYHAEWQTENSQGQDAQKFQEGNALTLAPRALLHRLPAGHSKLRFRIAVRLSGFGAEFQENIRSGMRLLGPWMVVPMESPITEAEEAGPAYIDGHGVPRGACAARGCPRFIPAKPKNADHVAGGSFRCRRCGGLAQTHQRQQDLTQPAKEIEETSPEQIDAKPELDTAGEAAESEAKHEEEVQEEPGEASQSAAEVPAQADNAKKSAVEAHSTETVMKEEPAKTNVGGLEQSKVYRVMHKVVFARRKPNTSAETCGTFVKGNEIRGVEKNGWVRIEYSKGVKLPGEAWMLIDGRQLGIGILLQPIMSLLEKDSTSISQWWIAKSLVLTRKEPSLLSERTGHLTKGQKVHGCRVGEWVELTVNPTLPNERTWVLIDGTSCGFGTLLERSHLGSALFEQRNDSKREASPKVVESVVEDQEYLAKKKELERKSFEMLATVEKSARIARKMLGPPLVYEVVNNGHVYEQPMPQARQVSRVANKDTILGYPGSVAWIRLDADHNEFEGWVPVREQGPGRELILRAVWKDLKVVRAYSEALSLQWPGIDEPLLNTVTYSVEWRTPAGRAPPLEGYAQSSKQTATLYGLPTGELVQVRVSLRIISTDADFRLMGTWHDFELARNNPSRGLSDSPIGKRSGGCAQTQCDGFVLDNRSKAGGISTCFRCGAKVEAHGMNARETKGDAAATVESSLDVQHVVDEAASNAQVLGEPLEFQVLGDQQVVEFYQRPFNSARVVRSIRMDSLQGYPGGNWVRVTSNTGDFEWARTTKANQNSNRSLKLVPIWANVQILNRYVEAVELTWPGLALKRAAYSIEWRVDRGSRLGASGHSLSLEPRALVHKLPPNTVISLRVSARIAADNGGDVKLTGGWHEVKTAEPILDEEVIDNGLSFDAFFVERGPCNASGCKGYISPSKEKLALNSKLATTACRRCGKGFESHIKIDGSSLQSDSRAPPTTTASATNTAAKDARKVDKNSPIPTRSGFALMKNFESELAAAEIHGDSQEYEVVNPVVYMRSAPNRSADIIGTLKQGALVYGVPVDGWLSLDESYLKRRFAHVKERKEGYLLIDGASIGLDLLLKPTGKTEVGGVTQQASDAAGRTQEERCQKALAEVQTVLPDGLEYDVYHFEGVNVHEKASKTSTCIKEIRQGTIAVGWPVEVEDWVYIPAEGGWAMANPPGAGVGSKPMMRPLWAAAVAEEKFEQALRLAWPGIALPDVSYAVEWRTTGASGSVRGDVVISRIAQHLLTSLPAGTDIRVRIRAIVQGLKFRGSWATFHTLEEEQRTFDGTYICRESKCKRFKPMTQVTSQPNAAKYIKMPWGEMQADELCRSCGMKFSEHRQSAAVSEAEAPTTKSQSAKSSSQTSKTSSKGVLQLDKSKVGPEPAGRERVQEFLAKGLVSGEVFEVVHSAVYVRDSMSHQAEALGMLPHGSIICGRRSNGWVCLDPYLYRFFGPLQKLSLGKKGFIMMNGKAIGLGQLLRPLNRGYADSGATLSQVEQQEKWQRLWQALTRRAVRTEKLIGFGGPLIFSVVAQEKVPMFQEPKENNARINGYLAEDVTCYPCGNWVRVVDKSFGSSTAAVPKGWALINSKGDAGPRRALLEPAWGAITVRTRYLEALELKWPGVPTKAHYAIEWRPVGQPGGGHVLSAFKSKLIYGLPANSSVRLRVLACVPPLATEAGVQQAGPVWLSGPWIVAQTLEAVPQNRNRDPSGKLRGSCEKSGCSQYCAPDEPVIRDQHTNPTKVWLCQRCGIQVEDHMCAIEGDEDEKPREETQHPIHILDLELPKNLARTSYKVLRSVMLRQGPTHEAERIAALPADLVVHGLEYNGWLRICQHDVEHIFGSLSSRPLKTDRVWACLDGKAWGCGTLIEQCSRDYGEQDAEELDLASNILLPPELGIINANPTEIYTKSIEYQVAVDSTVVREKPSFRSKVTDILSQNDRVHGFPWNGWLLLHRRVHTDRAAWVYIRELESGSGPILKPQNVQPTVKRAFAEAVVLQWEKVPAKYVTYSLQWSTKKENRTQNDLRNGPLNVKDTMATLNGLPAQSVIYFRIVAKVFLSAADMDNAAAVSTMIVGDWYSGTTGRKIEHHEMSLQSSDPLTKNRGRCMGCEYCPSYVLLQDKRFNESSKLNELLCRRCGCPCTSHAVVHPDSNRPQSRFGTSGGGQNRTAPPTRVSSQAPVVSDAASMTWSPADPEAKDNAAAYVIKMVGKARTHYETLGVKPSSAAKDLRNAYRQISLRVHPDKVRNTEATPELLKNAEAAFKQVAAAYEVVGDEGKRAAYDKKIRGKTLTPMNQTKPTSSSGGPSKETEERRRSSKPKNTVVLKVTHAISGQHVEMVVEAGISGLDLKKDLCRTVRRGPASHIDLADKHGATISDKGHINVGGIVYCIGINLGPPKKLKLKVRDLKTGVHMFLDVLDTVTMFDVTDRVADILGVNRRHIKLGVFKSGSARSFDAFDGDDTLNGRTELILMATAEHGAMFFSLDQAIQVQEDLIEAYSDATFQSKLDELLKQYPPPDCLANSIFRNKFTFLVQAAQKLVCEKWGYVGAFGMSHMMSAFQQVGMQPEVYQRTAKLDVLLRVTQQGMMPYDPKLFEKHKEDKARRQGATNVKKAPKAVEEVTITIRPAKLEGYEKGSLQLTLLSNSTFSQVKDAIAARIPDVKAKDIKLVFTQKSRATGSSTFASFRDTEKIGPRRQILALGLKLPQTAPDKAKEPTKKTKNLVEVTLTVQELSGKRSIQIRAFTTSTIAEVKEALSDRLKRSDMFAQGAVLVKKDNRGLTAPWRDEEPLGSARLIYLRFGTLEHKSLLEYDENLEATRPVPKEQTGWIGIEIIHAIDGDLIPMRVPGNATIKAVRELLSGLLQRPEIFSEGSIVRRSGGEFPALADNAPLGGRRKLLFLGVALGPPSSNEGQQDIRASVQAVREAPATATAVVEVTIKLHRSEEEEVVLEIRRDTHMGQVKVALARWLGRPDIVKSARFISTLHPLTFCTDGEKLGRRHVIYVQCSDLKPAPDSPGARHLEAGGVRREQQTRRVNALLADEALELLGELRRVVLQKSFQDGLNKLEYINDGDARDTVSKALKERTQAEFANELTKAWGPTLIKFGYGGDESGFHEMFTAVSALHRTPGVRREVFAIERALRMDPGGFFGIKPKEEEKQAPVEVKVRIRHALDGDDVHLTVMSDCTIDDVLKELSVKFKRKELYEKGRFVRDKSGSFFAYDRDSILGKRRKLLFLGVPLGMVEEPLEERTPDVSAEFDAAAHSLPASGVGSNQELAQTEQVPERVDALEDEDTVEPLALADQADAEPKSELLALAPADEDLVEVRVKLAGYGEVQVKARRTWSLREVREALATQLSRSTLIDEYRFARHGDDELLEEKRRLLLIEAPPPAPEDVLALPEKSENIIKVRDPDEFIEGFEELLPEDEPLLPAPQSDVVQDADVSAEVHAKTHLEEKEADVDTSSELAESSESDVEKAGVTTTAGQVTDKTPEVLIVVPDGSTAWQRKVLNKLLAVIQGQVVPDEQWQEDPSQFADVHLVRLESLDPSAIEHAARQSEDKAEIVEDEVIDDEVIENVTDQPYIAKLQAGTGQNQIGTMEVEVRAAAGDAQIWIDVPTDGTIKQVKEAIAVRCSDWEILGHIRLVRKYSASMFLPFRDAEIVGARRVFLLMGVNLTGIAPRDTHSAVGGLESREKEDCIAGFSQSGCEAAALLIAAMELFEDVTIMKALIDMDAKTGGILASWEPPWEAEGVEDLDARFLSMKPQKLVRAWAESFAGVVDSLAEGAHASSGTPPVSPEEDLEEDLAERDLTRVTLKHAVTGHKILVRVPSSATMADVKDAACKKLTLNADSTDMKLIKRTKNSLNEFLDGELLGGRKKLLAAGVDLKKACSEVVSRRIWVKHGTDGDAVVVHVPSSATFLDLKRAIVEHLDRPTEVLECNLVKIWSDEGDHVFHRDAELLVNKTHVVATGISFQSAVLDMETDLVGDAHAAEEIVDEDVELLLEHAESKNSMKITVHSSATMWDVKEVVALTLGVGQVSSILLARWVGPHGSVLACYSDDMPLGQRRTLLLHGIELSSEENDPSETAEPLHVETEPASAFSDQDVQPETVGTEVLADDEVVSEPEMAEVTGAGDTVSEDEVLSEPGIAAEKQQAQNPIDQSGPLGVLESDDEVISEPPSDTEIQEQADIHQDASAAAVETMAEDELQEGSEEDVDVILEHAETGEQTEVTVASSCTMLEVKEALLSKLGSGDASEVRLVKWSGPYKTVLAGYNNDTRLGHRRHLLVLGVDIPADHAGTADVEDVMEEKADQDPETPKQAKVFRPSVKARASNSSR